MMRHCINTAAIGAHEGAGILILAAAAVPQTARAQSDTAYSISFAALIAMVLVAFKVPGGSSAKQDAPSRP